jgi:alkylation response protein AidB-like acyl-CoA dehydrogenase
MAVTYRAPRRDMRFVLHELLDVGRLAALPGYEDATPDVIDAVLDEGAKLCENVLLPLNRPGDEEGCAYENGVVRTPNGFKEAYRTFAEGGWTSLACDPAYGGQGLPKALNVAFVEMVCSTNLSFGTYPALSAGAYNAIAAHAPEEQIGRAHV